MVQYGFVCLIMSQNAHEISTQIIDWKKNLTYMYTHIHKLSDFFFQTNPDFSNAINVTDILNANG